MQVQLAGEAAARAGCRKVRAGRREAQSVGRLAEAAVERHLERDDGAAIEPRELRAELLRLLREEVARPQADAVLELPLGIHRRGGDVEALHVGREEAAAHPG